MNGLISGKSKAKSSVVCALAALGAMFALPAWAELKIGVVDYSRLVEESPQAKVALDAIRTEFTPRQRDLQNQQQTLKTKEEKLQKDGAQAFVKSWEQLLQRIKDKTSALTDKSKGPSLQ